MYEVRWTRQALEDFSKIWKDAPDLQAVSMAFVELDRKLSQDPEGNSESRPDEQRVLYALPLGVRFFLKPSRKQLHVIAIWRVMMKRQGQG